MRLEDVIARADSGLFGEMIGRGAIELLTKLDPSLIAPGRLQEMLFQTRTGAELIQDKDSRRHIVSLLRGPERSELARELGVDPSTLTRTLDALRAGSTGEDTVLAFFGLVRAESAAPTVVGDEVVGTSTYGLFAHQRTAKRKVEQLLSDEPRRALLHMPTGSGKTRTAMNLIADWLRSREPTVVVWLAHSEELCEQAATEFERAWSHLGDRDVQVFRMWGANSPETGSMRDGIVVAGLGKTSALLNRSLEAALRLVDSASLVVMDEAHQAIAPTYKEILNLLSIDAALIGLTATPGRTWNDPMKDKELVDFFASKRVRLEVDGYSNPIEYLVEDGYLARTNFKAIKYGGVGRLSQDQLRELETHMDVPSGVLESVAEDQQRNLVIMSEVESILRSGHKRVLVFAATVAHSRLLAAVLEARGHRASHVAGDTPSGERQRLIAEYSTKSDEPMVLCNFGVLTTGFDAPQTSAALIARPTKSLVLYSQMVGRATRGRRAGGNEHAEVRTVVDVNLPGFGDLGDAFENWEDVWLQPETH